MNYDDESHRKHLEFAQSNIARMASASFAYKSWMIAIIAAVFAAYASSKEEELILVALIPLFAFWVLDGFHLATEKNFRKLYDKIRQEDARPFDMNPGQASASEWIAAAFSKTLLPLYVPLLFVIIASYFFLGKGDFCG